MSSAMQITYLSHSGFAVRTHDTLLVFDDARGAPPQDASLLTGYITPSLVAAHARTLFFASHAHGDHFNPAIYAMDDGASVQYVLGYDVPPPYEGHRMRPGDAASFGDVSIRAFGSTDEGVSFLIHIDGWTIFHAGDLNYWHWRAESTHKEVEEAERAFYEALQPLIGEKIDFAFFPVDPRMGEMYDAGALYFLMHVKPRVLLPMHWWGRDDAARDFARRNRTKHVEIIALTQEGETIRAHRQAGGGLLIDM